MISVKNVVASLLVLIAGLLLLAAPANATDPNDTYNVTLSVVGTQVTPSGYASNQTKVTTTVDCGANNMVLNVAGQQGQLLVSPKTFDNLGSTYTDLGGYAASSGSTSTEPAFTMISSSGDFPSGTIITNTWNSNAYAALQSVVCISGLASSPLYKNGGGFADNQNNTAGSPYTFFSGVYVPQGYLVIVVLEGWGTTLTPDTADGWIDLTAADLNASGGNVMHVFYQYGNNANVQFAPTFSGSTRQQVQYFIFQPAGAVSSGGGPCLIGYGIGKCM